MPDPMDDVQTNGVHVLTDTTISTATPGSEEDDLSRWRDDDVEAVHRRFDLSRPEGDARPGRPAVPQEPEFKQYSVTVETRQLPPRSQRLRRVDSRQATQSEARRRGELNSAAWQYTKCAVLFFIALLITWVSTVSTMLADHRRLTAIAALHH